MKAGQFAFCLLVLGASRASAASFVSGEAIPGTAAVPPYAAGPAVQLLPRELKFSVSPLTDLIAPAADAPVAAADVLKVPEAEAAIQAPADSAHDQPTDEDMQAAALALILRNPALPPRVANLIERELGLTIDHPLFENISRSGGQPRNANTNEPIGEPYAAVNPAREIAGFFHLRQESPAYYQSLKNPKTGVVATGVRGGVDTMVDDLLEKGYIPPRSQGRNLRFRNGVYMDLPSDIHEARKFAAVDPYRTEGKDRYPLVVSFRAGDVHNPGSEHQGRIMGDGGTLGQVALDQVTPSDIVSIYVPKDRVAQTAARLKGTALAHVSVFTMDILPKH
ncbi:MAG: hypothetical protein ACHQ2Z_11645 [Elusimicrobiota bacterium]